MKRNYSNESGFTLIEVLIAIAMIGLIMLGFGYVHPWPSLGF